MSKSTKYASSTFSKLPKLHARIPFGYTIDPDDPSYILPVYDTLEALETALEYLAFKSVSYREAARFIKEFSGEVITYEGLRLMIKTMKHPIFHNGEYPD